jgi:replicative DNA helicase
MGLNVVFITLEMADYKVVKRIGSNLLNIPMSEYDKVAQDTDFMKRKLDKIGNGIMPPGTLIVKQFPTSQATVIDVENYLKDIEETSGIKINVVVLDYINIMSNHRNPNSDNTYIKIKQLSEDLRGMAVRHNFLIVTATQVSKGGWDSSDLKMENIAESAGLAHTADLVYGIIQDATMHANREYWLKVLKIRDGEGKGTKCRFDINYNLMKLTETSDTIAMSDM